MRHRVKTSLSPSTGGWEQASKLEHRKLKKREDRDPKSITIPLPFVSFNLKATSRKHCVVDGAGIGEGIPGDRAAYDRTVIALPATKKRRVNCWAGNILS